MEQYVLRFTLEGEPVELVGPVENLQEMLVQAKAVMGRAGSSQAQVAQPAPPQPVIGIQPIQSVPENGPQVTQPKPEDLLQPSARKTKSAPKPAPQPQLAELVARGIKANEREWTLVYALYTTQQKQRFSKEDIRALYRQTGRWDDRVSKNFAAGLRGLEAGEYITRHGSGYQLEERGRNRAMAVLARPAADSGARVPAAPKSPPAKPARSPARKPARKSASPIGRNYRMVATLRLTDKERASFHAFWQRHEKPSAMDAVIQAAYWLDEVKAMRDVSIDEVYTLLRRCGVDIGNDVASALRNARNKNHYFDQGLPSGVYRLSHKGRARVEALQNII